MADKAKAKQLPLVDVELPDTVYLYFWRQTASKNWMCDAFHNRAHAEEYYETDKRNGYVVDGIHEWHRSKSTDRRARVQKHVVTPVTEATDTGGGSVHKEVLQDVLPMLFETVHNGGTSADTGRVNAGSLERTKPKAP